MCIYTLTVNTFLPPLSDRFTIHSKRSFTSIADQLYLSVLTVHLGPARVDLAMVLRQRRIATLFLLLSEARSVHSLQGVTTPIRKRNFCAYALGEADELARSVGQRREKKNKYIEFSKVTSGKDPFESLLEESFSKRKALDDDIARKDDLSSSPPKIGNSGSLSFPDNKNIDPYDPTTFGYIEVGIVLGAHGVHGWVKVKPTTSFPIDRLCVAGIKHLKPPKKRAPRKVLLLEGKRRNAEEYLIKLEQINDRDEALKLRGSLLYVREEEKMATDQEEYMVSDLVGSEVFLDTLDTVENPLFLGVVNGVVFADEMCSIPGLGHDMLEVVLRKGQDGMASLRDELVLIPMVPQIVTHVSAAKGVIHINPPSGLLDLTYLREERAKLKGFLPPGKG